MKKIMFSLVIGLAFITNSYGQKPSSSMKLVKEITVNKNQYNVYKSDNGNTIVEPALLRLNSTKSSPMGSDLPSFKLQDNKGLVNAFYEAFGSKRLQQLLPERSLFVTFTANSSTGQVIYTSYMLRKNSTITFEELDSLGAEIKKHVVFVFDKHTLKGAAEVTIGSNLSLSKIVDGSIVLR